jgi:hypothetical protein
MASRHGTASTEFKASSIPRYQKKAAARPHGSVADGQGAGSWRLIRAI